MAAPATCNHYKHAARGSLRVPLLPSAEPVITIPVEMAFKFLVLALLCVAVTVEAQFTSEESKLRDVVLNGGSLTLAKDIILTADLPPIPVGKTVTIIGALGGKKAPVKIDGQRRFTIFRSSDSATLSLTNLVIANAALPVGEVIPAAVDIKGVLKVDRVKFLANPRAIHSRGATATISKSQFVGQFKTAVYILPGSSFTFSGCAFSNNKAADTDFADGGGAIHVESNYDSSASVVVSKTSFKGNSAAGSAGGAVYLTTLATGKFIDCSFSKNSAPDGGAIRAYNSYLTTIRCSFSGNTADNGGALLMASDGEGTYEHFKATFTGNKAANTGGAFVLRQEATADFCSCTFKSNTANGVQNNGHGAISDGPRIGVSPPGTIKFVTVDPGRDPAEFAPGTCATAK